MTVDSIRAPAGATTLTKSNIGADTAFQSVAARRGIKLRPCGEALPAIDLLPRIERVCTARGIRPSRFGRRAVGDPRLVHDIRNGRGLRAATRERVEAYLKRLEWLLSIKGGV